MFKNIFTFSKQIQQNQKENEYLKLEILHWQEKAKQIQSSFDFVVPTYIIDEIIEKGDSIYKDYENLYCLINCAVMNNRITQQNANKIKQIYKYN